MRSVKSRSKRRQRGGALLTINFKKPTQDYKFDFFLTYNNNGSVVVTSVGNNTTSDHNLRQIQPEYVLKSMTINRIVKDITNISLLAKTLQYATPQHEITFLFEYNSIPISVPTPSPILPSHIRSGDNKPNSNSYMKMILSPQMSSAADVDDPYLYNGGKRSRKRRRKRRRRNTRKY